MINHYSDQRNFQCMSRSSRITSNKTVAKELLLLLPFSMAFLDTFFNYILSNHFFQFRVGIISLVSLLVVLIFFGGRIFRISEKWLAYILFLQLSLLIGIFTAPDIGTSRIFQIISIIVYFYCGYIAFRWSTSSSLIQMVLMVLGSIYVIVCTVALLKLYPSIFPIIESVWSQNGVLQSRPEVTTDQNFQVFYLIPVALAIVMPLTTTRLLILSILVVGALFTLSQLQTRSGFIAFLIILFLGLISALKNKQMGRKKIVFLPIISIVAFLAFLPYIVNTASLLIYRFTDHGYDTAQGRLDSALYLVDKLFNITWWLPRGNSEFLQATGNVPHTNITALFLEGGIFGLVLWFCIIVIPTLSLGIKIFFKGNLDPIAVIVGCAGLGVLALQLTLNVPVHSQVWLWTGAVIAIHERINMQRKKK